MDKINFENENVQMRIAHGILYMKYKVSILDLPSVTDVVQTRLALSKGHDFPMFVDISGIRKTTKEARTYSAQGDATKLVAATALWGSSELTRLMANFFLAIYKPAVPIRFFTAKGKAVQWLKQFKPA